MASLRGQGIERALEVAFLGLGRRRSPKTAVAALLQGAGPGLHPPISINRRHRVRPHLPAGGQG